LSLFESERANPLVEQRRATFKEGTKGSHLKVYFQGLQTVIPVHHGKDLKAGTLHAILRDLGLRKEDIK